MPLAGRVAAGAAAALPVDGGWPRAYTTASGARLVLYEPQVASWVNQKRIEMYAAVSYSGKDQRTPALGTLRIEADTRISRRDRLVDFSDLTVTAANFPTLSLDQLTAAVAEINTSVPRDERVIGLDRVLAALDTSRVTPRNVDGVRADPPVVFYSTKPAVLINLDGDPIWSPTGQNDLRFAVNASRDLFEHMPSSSYYVRIDTTWMTATSLDGPWTRAGRLPESFSKLPDEDRWKDARSAVRERSAGSVNPTVLVSTRPAELVLLRGAPVYVPVRGTGLLWISNTDSDVFRAGKTGTVYYLVAGRWFSAPDFTGPWTFASLSLPPEFKKIPLEHPRSRVLASVPGTDQAAEAVLLAQIPQTARVNRKEIKAPEVAFQGDPSFQPIEQTTVQRAVNTDKDVFKVGDQYYMCYQGVWFVSKTATGPWEVATSVPEAIYKIPVSSPANHVTYVTVEDSNDEYVTFATAAAYTGVMVAWGCAVWGSGWYYPPYWGYGGFYPYYYPHFPTYGYSAWYNPWTGAYGRSARVYGPYGGAGVGARYNPRTGTYARGAAAYGPYGARGVAQAYNPRTGTYAATRQGSNVYGNWGSSYVQRGDDWAKTNRYTNNRTGNTTRTVRSSEGNAVIRKGDNGGRVAAGSGGDVYAGRDGNVYRRDNGTWQKYENGGWNNTPNQPGDRPTPNSNRTTGDRAAGTGTTTNRTTPSTSSAGAASTSRDSAARSEGAARSGSYSNYRSGSGTSGTGSYRSGGGAR